jgi:phosphomethylpyrimidine synthase
MIKNGARDQDLAMRRARRDMLWNEQFDLALDPETARKVRSERHLTIARSVTMCEDYCALKIIKENIDLRK